MPSGTVCCWNSTLERVDERLIGQLFADASQLLGESGWVAAMEVCFDVIEVGVRRSCNYISGIREPAAVEFDCEEQLPLRNACVHRHRTADRDGLGMLIEIAIRPLRVGLSTAERIHHQFDAHRIADVLRILDEPAFVDTTCVVLARSVVVTVAEEQFVVLDRVFGDDEVNIGGEPLVECGNGPAADENIRQASVVDRVKRRQQLLFAIREAHCAGT